MIAEGPRFLFSCDGSVLCKVAKSMIKRFQNYRV
nr:MAG TPA: hypothetical protein [Caudoviricetes sp.]